MKKTQQMIKYLTEFEDTCQNISDANVELS